MSRALCRAIVFVMGVITGSIGGAQPNEPPTVFTRARLTSTYEEAGGKLYVRLKLMPMSKIPFTTHTFLVTNRRLLAAIPQGSWVKFTAKHIDGENTLTAIHVVAECKRFRPCD